MHTQDEKKQELDMDGWGAQIDVFEGATGKKRGVSQCCGYILKKSEAKYMQQGKKSSKPTNSNCWKPNK